MPNLWTYRLAIDAGVAPHISDGILTLTLCKPVVRKGAAIGDYVLALVAKGLRTKAQKNDNATATGYKFRGAYLFKVEEKINLTEYQGWCSIHAGHKLCTEATGFMGDCQYNAGLAYMPGPHGPNQRNRNLSGVNALVSRNYAAWTAEAAKVFTKEELESMGIDYAQAEGVTQGQFKSPLTPANIVAIDTMIGSGPHPTNSEVSLGARPAPVAVAVVAAAEEEEANGNGAGALPKPAVQVQCSSGAKKGGSRRKYKKTKQKPTRKSHGRRRV